MKTILKSISAAFSIYSKIPMPGFQWDSSDMRYHLIFFPWIGAVIGGLEWMWYLLADSLQIGTTMFLLLGAAIPILITGGFHVDGFMDTMDAIHSYQNQEKKLEILKDPHIGAFSVICLLGYILLYLGFFSEIGNIRFYGVYCCSFILSRALSGISVISFPTARKDGMLQAFASTAERRMVMFSLVIQMVLCMALMLYISILAGAVVIGGMGLTFLYYRVMSQKQFGGITGDLAGFFVTMAELAAVILAGTMSVLM